VVIVALTPEELARCDRAIEKIRRKLFAQHTAQEFGFLEGSQTIMPPYAENRWNAGCGNYRVIRWGGLRFHFVAGNSRFELTITHTELDRFLVHIGNEKGHTEMVAPTNFVLLGEFVWRHVEKCRRATKARKMVAEKP
jgi:hypothetical protein